MTADVPAKRSDSGTFDWMRRAAYSKPPGESVWFSKSEISSLPSEFSETTLGTPLWLAHPGSVTQFRASPALHTYELDEGWELHRDRFDPQENPLGHIVFDAPEIMAGAFAAIFTGIATWCYVDELERERREGPRWWVPILAAVGVALLAGFFIYLVGAMVRVSLGIG